MAVGYFLKDNTKMHEFEQKFIVHKWKTLRLNESYRLVTTILVLDKQNRKICDIFQTTIAAAARSRHSYFWARRGSVAVGFLFLSPRCGSGALAFFFYRRGAAAVSFQPRWTSLQHNHQEITIKYNNNNSFSSFSFIYLILSIFYVVKK